MRFDYDHPGNFYAVVIEDSLTRILRATGILLNVNSEWCYYPFTTISEYEAAELDQISAKLKELNK